MLEQKICVVGDKFENFAGNENIITISNLEDILSKDNLANNKYELAVGQGVNQEKLLKLIDMIEGKKLNNNIAINRNKRKSSTFLTHKRKSENIMISDPTHDMKTHIYEAYLMVDDDCAEMSDHMSGQHIQGMMLIEAARQMVIAVTEKFFIPEHKKGKMTFVTHHTNSIFHTFVFPTEIKIQYQIKKIKPGVNGNLTAEVLIDFVQDNVIATQVDFKFSVLDAGFMKEKEAEMAVECIRSYLKINEDRGELDQVKNATG